MTPITTDDHVNVNQSTPEQGQVLEEPNPLPENPFHTKSSKITIKLRK